MQGNTKQAPKSCSCSQCKRGKSSKVGNWASNQQDRSLRDAFVRAVLDAATSASTTQALANVVTDFVKAGWPKGKEPGAGEAA